VGHLLDRSAKDAREWDGVLHYGLGTHHGSVYALSKGWGHCILVFIHSPIALSRYRKHGGKRDLERSIAELVRALSICLPDGNVADRTGSKYIAIQAKRDLEGVIRIPYP
jgi:hypothetical protein